MGRIPLDSAGMYRNGGGTMVGEVNVLSVHEHKPLTELEATVRRQSDGEVVLEGRCGCYTFMPEEGAPDL